VTIVGMPESVIAEDARAHPDRTPMRLFIAARHARGDEVVAAGLRRGTRQVVILGAGLDTTAYRLVAPQGTTVFEVDHPATQDWKREQVAAVGLEPATALTHVGVDFERDGLLDALVRAGLDRRAATVCLWLGVVPYLTGPGVEATLRAIASLHAAEVVFDYSEPPSARSGQAQACRQARARRVAALGEPWLSHFDPPQLHALLASAGLDVVRDDHAGDLVRDYLGLSRNPTRRSGGHVLHASTPGRTG
jgi:methyltransferase (TIGR00027 family)